MHDIDQDDETSFQMQDYDFTTNVRQTAHTNIVYDEISSDRKLQCLLTDVKLSDNSGASSTVRIKLIQVLVAIYCHLTFTRKFILRYLSKICVKLLTKGFA